MTCWCTWQVRSAGDGDSADGYRWRGTGGREVQGTCIRRDGRNVTGSAVREVDGLYMIRRDVG